MHPAPRETRTANNPGLVNLPKPRRRPSDVAAKKKKKQTAAAKDVRLAQVAQVEDEIRFAQKEAAQVSGQVGVRGRVKKTFRRETPVIEAEEHPSPPPKRKADIQISGKSKRTKPTEADEIILASDSEEAPSTSQPTVPKPRGLTTTRHHAPAVNTVISNFEYEQEGSESHSEGEDKEDKLEYPGDAAKSLVSIKLASTSKAPSQTGGNSHAGVRSLPSAIHRSFLEDFVPAILEEVGCSRTPWKNPDFNTIQVFVNEVYPEIEYIVEKGDALETSVNARVMGFRNIISAQALNHIQAFIKNLEKEPNGIEVYVRSAMIYHGEVPFLYKVFKPTLVPVNKKKERGGYAVTRQGLFQNQMILDTTINYYGKRGIKQYLPTASSTGRNPIGMLTLVCTAVKRALLMHSTSTFIMDGRPFFNNNWGHRTAVYAKLAGDMTDSQWNKFYVGLGYTEAIKEKLKECSKPVQHWTDDPDEYFIVGSDPVEEQ